MLFVAMLPFVAGFAQDAAEGFDTYIADLNAQCPITYDDDWAITSFSLDGDTVKLELEAPAALSMFLPMLTDNTEGVRRLWFNQMNQYGDRWKRFVAAVANADCTLSLIVIPINCDEGATVTFSPADLMKY